MQDSNEKKRSRLWLLLLAAVLPACATPPQLSASACPDLPLMPLARQPIPPLPYSESARNDMERWQKRLTESSLTGKC